MEKRATTRRRGGSTEERDKRARERFLQKKTGAKKKITEKFEQPNNEENFRLHLCAYAHQAIKFT